MQQTDIDSRYLRHIMLAEIGREGQLKLLHSAALIVGLGGLGSPVAQYLTAAGVGRIGLCDADTVSDSNLQRQVLYTEDMRGVPKAEAARQRLAAMSSHTVFDVYPDGLTADNAADIIGRYDIVVDCCDNFATRYLIDDTCRYSGKPWVYGSINAFTGQLSTFMPDAKVRYADIYPDRDELSARPAASGGVLGAVPGVIGSLQAATAIKILLGMPDALVGTLLTVDIKNMRFNNIELF